jgi:hypothetical protein
VGWLILLLAGRIAEYLQKSFPNKIRNNQKTSPNNNESIKKRGFDTTQDGKTGYTLCCRNRLTFTICHDLYDIFILSWCTCGVGDSGVAPSFDARQTEAD